VQRSTRYTITASNATSSVNQFFSLAVTLAAPGAPLQPTVVVGNGRATVTVAAGVGGTPTSYQVSASPQVGGVTKTCWVRSASGSCTVWGLTNGVAYTFSAIANNATGTSVASSASESVTPQTCAAGGTCTVGSTGPGGGIVFYVASEPFSSPGSDCNTAGVGGISTCKYLEAARSDRSSRIAWATTAAGCYNSGGTTSTNNCQTNSIYSGNSAAQLASRTASTGFGMGMSNTNQIYARLTTAGGVATSRYAAGFAWAYTNNSKTDWFLPSKDELNELCKYAKNTGQDAGSGTECAGGSAATLRGFSIGTYWSSSETAEDNASLALFLAGYGFGYDKWDSANVRPVRAF
jgi:hypothetical protein